MRPVECRIFNALVLRESVELPEIGTLWVDRIPAGLKGRSLNAPRNVVRFSTKGHEGSLSVIDLLSDSGVAEAERVYQEWRDALPSLTSFDIDGVGRLQGKSFMVSKELDAILNPEIIRGSVKLKRRRKFRWLWFSLVGVVILTTGFFILCEKPDAMWQRQIRAIFSSGDRIEADKEPLLVTDITKETVDEDNSLPANPPAVVPADSVRNIAEACDADAGEVAQTASRYIVVGGVFSVAENADKYITRMKRKYPSLLSDYAKIPYKGNKIMVALYVSADMDAAQAKLRQMARETSIRDLWIYRSEPR